MGKTSARASTRSSAVSSSAGVWRNVSGSFWPMWVCASKSAGRPAASIVASNQGPRIASVSTATAGPYPARPAPSGALLRRQQQADDPQQPAGLQARAQRRRPERADLALVARAVDARAEGVDELVLRDARGALAVEQLAQEVLARHPQLAGGPVEHGE